MEIQSQIYNTKLLGTLKELEDCNIIRIFKRGDSVLSDWEKDLPTGVDLRKSSDGTFKYAVGDGSFDTILFLGPENRIIAYSIYRSLQGSGYNININIDLDDSILEPLKGEARFDLGRIESPSTDLSTHYFKLGYASKADIEEESRANQYTISACDSKKIIDLGGDRVVDGKLLNLSIASGFNIDPDSVGVSNFNTYSFGYYLGGPVIYKWRSNDEGDVIINIQSLRDLNRFGYPISITKKNLTLKGAHSITSISGKYAKTPAGIYNLGNPNFEMEDSREVISGLGGWLDSWESGSILHSLDEVCPKYPKGTVLKKTGDWYEVYLGESENVLSGPYGDLWLGTGDRYYILSDREVMIIDSEYYYIIYDCYMKSWKTERARRDMEGGSIDEVSYKIHMNLGGKNDEYYQGEFLEGKYIKSIYRWSNLKDTPLNKLRRKAYRWEEFESIPEIVGTLEGLLFYIDSNNNLDYL